ncbi:hypothetical protein PAHAL_9G484800 [Panicum hallii]|uniref:Uncharacterized protein n=1 Tax=Panicum hallii TaxID=206008 RepID=A0A2T8I534_9POAL|nr:hypothetical protein PAHAL_9G484800 [Panicum hallii]
MASVSWVVTRLPLRIGSEISIGIRRRTTANGQKCWNQPIEVWETASTSRSGSELRVSLRYCEAFCSERNVLEKVNACLGCGNSVEKISVFLTSSGTKHQECRDLPSQWQQNGISVDEE